MVRLAPESCPGADDPDRRCGKHHPTDLADLLGGYLCCCGESWMGTRDCCTAGGREGDWVGADLRLEALLGHYVDDDALIEVLRPRLLRLILSAQRQAVLGTLRVLPERS